MQEWLFWNLVRTVASVICAACAAGALAGVAIHMHEQTAQYNLSRAPEARRICDLLAREIESVLPEAENKVWFMDGNAVVGYSKLKEGARRPTGLQEHRSPQGKTRAAQVTRRAAARDGTRTSGCIDWPLCVLESD